MLLRIAPRLAVLAVLAGCVATPERAAVNGGIAAGRPEPAYAAPPPPAGARTAAQFDTTTPEQRRAASEAAPGAEEVLGVTVASLGDVTEGGLWLSTRLVSERREGRVEVVATGQSASLELRPAEGGSRLSLAAMRLLQVPLTDLAEVKVHVR